MNKLIASVLVCRVIKMTEANPTEVMVTLLAVHMIASSVLVDSNLTNRTVLCVVDKPARSSTVFLLAITLGCQHDYISHSGVRTIFCPSRSCTIFAYKALSMQQLRCRSSRRAFHRLVFDLVGINITHSPPSPSPFLPLSLPPLSPSFSPFPVPPPPSPAPPPSLRTAHFFLQSLTSLQAAGACGSSMQLKHQR